MSSTHGTITTYNIHIIVTFINFNQYISFFLFLTCCNISTLVIHGRRQHGEDRDLLISVNVPFIPLQVSACIPVLRLSRHRKKVLFYCHFPDQLLTQRKSILKKLYRAPIDWVEERTTGMADMVCKGWGFCLSVV